MWCCKMLANNDGSISRWILGSFSLIQKFFTAVLVSVSVGIRFAGISIHTCQWERTDFSGHPFPLRHSLGIPARTKAAPHGCKSIHDLQASFERMFKAAEGYCICLWWLEGLLPGTLTTILWNFPAVWTQNLESDLKHWDKSQSCIFLGGQESCFSICFMEFMYNVLWKALKGVIGTGMKPWIGPFWSISLPSGWLFFSAVSISPQRKAQDGCPCCFLHHVFFFFVLFSCYLCWIMMNQVSCYKSCSYVTLFPCLRDKILPTYAISFLPFA